MTLNQTSTVRAGMTTETVFATTEAVAREVSKVVVGQETLVHRLLTALFTSIPYSFTRSMPKAQYAHRTRLLHDSVNP